MFTHEGTHELDACVMDGSDLSAGAVTGDGEGGLGPGARDRLLQDHRVGPGVVITHLGPVHAQAQHVQMSVMGRGKGAGGFEDRTWPKKFSFGKTLWNWGKKSYKNTVKPFRRIYDKKGLTYPYCMI